ncbi:hypothetical protein BLOT_012162 [Blomia tropicalis]|nr:hypothetical protein BLOT_012162 [Blomia tropicalis]
MQQLQFYIVDAFVDPDKPFSGNPAAVVLLDNDDDIDDSTKQNIAGQFNLSETVFVSKLNRDQNGSRSLMIRWFTPTNEVELCGHATIAASYVLFERERSVRTLVYETKFGQRLECTMDGERRLNLNFPSNDPVQIECKQYRWIDQLVHAIIGELPMIDTSIVNIYWSESTKKLLLRMESKDGQLMLTNLKPDFHRLKEIDTDGMVRGVIITQKADRQRDGVHFWSRYFSPWNGINEDPVTGSSFTVLAPYWRKQLNENGTLYAKQVSSRSGLVRCTTMDNRVSIEGFARIFCLGTCHVYE